MFACGSERSTIISVNSWTHLSPVVLEHDHACFRVDALQDQRLVSSIPIGHSRSHYYDFTVWFKPQGKERVGSSPLTAFRSKVDHEAPERHRIKKRDRWHAHSFILYFITYVFTYLFTYTNIYQPVCFRGVFLAPKLASECCLFGQQ